MIRNIIFDFDGVLLESVEVKTRAFRQLFGGEPPEQVSKIIAYHLRNGGISRFEKFRTIYRDILERPLAESEFQRLCDRFAECVEDEVVASPWVPGAKEFLDAQRGKYRFFVVSGTPDAEIKNIVKRKHLGDYFVEVLGSPRNKAELLQDLAERHALVKSEMLYVGDSVNDWRAAQAFGIGFIWRRPSDALETLPDFLGPMIPSLLQLEEALQTCRA